MTNQNIGELTPERLQQLQEFEEFQRWKATKKSPREKLPTHERIARILVFGILGSVVLLVGLAFLASVQSTRFEEQTATTLRNSRLLGEQVENLGSGDWKEYYETEDLMR